MNMNLYTIGFTQKTARQFFALLKQHGVQRLVDIRLHPGGQLSGFTKQPDLEYFLQEILNRAYVHLPILAPSDSLMTDYRKDHDWTRYVTRFEALMDERGIPQAIDLESFAAIPSCLLCSEADPDRCHRRLVAERFARADSRLTIVHLK